MMGRTRKMTTGIVTYVSLAGATSIAFVACTHDFDAYRTDESGTPSSDGSVETGTTIGKDGSTLPSPEGGSVPVEASTGETSTGCTQAAACGTTETSCKSACEATLSTCIAACGGGNGGCKAKCMNDRDKCVTGCTTTCHTCAGAACLSACN